MMERRIFDWRFVAAFAVMMLVAVAAWGFVQRQHQVNGLIVVAQRTTAQVELLNTQLDQLRADYARSTAESTAERDELQQQNKRLHDQMKALLDYLRAHGVAIPRTLAPDDTGGVGHPKGAGPRGPKTPRPPTSPSPPASPAPTATPAPTTPGVLDPVCELLHVPLICR